VKLIIALDLWWNYGLPGDYMRFGLVTAWRMAGDIMAFRRSWVAR